MASKIELLSDDEMESVSAFDITDTLDLHDPRFGSTGSMQFQCPTCGMQEDACIGHHALLRFSFYMFHPLVYKEAEKIINNTCMACGGARGHNNRCTECGEVVHKDYAIKSLNTKRHKKNADTYHAAVRSTVTNDNKYIFPEQVLHMMPKGYVVSSILVPPVYLRTPKEIEWSSDIQKHYEELVKRVKVFTNAHRTSEVQRAKAAYVISEVYSKIIGSKSSTGIIGSVSKKDGVFRKLMLGKRVEQSARSVITPDPCIAIDEVAVPRIIISKVRLPVLATPKNLTWLKNLAEYNTLWTHNDVQARPRNVICGMQFLRMPENGDKVLLNRQPSLSRESMMCFKVVIRHDEYKTIGINPQVVVPFNADFDGDEMNIFFFDSKDMELCADFNSVLVPVQDVVSGCYIMSKDNEDVSEDVWNNCMMFFNLAQPGQDILPRRAFYPGAKPHELLETCLPGHNIEHLTKNCLKTIIRLLGKETLEILQHVVLVWLENRGLTVPLSSVACTYRPETHEADPDHFRELCIGIAQTELAGAQILDIVDSGAKGSITHISNMAVSLGQQYILGKPGVFCKNSYFSGLTPKEFFGHQMAAREGVVSTGVNTASTGYLNRRVCTILADVYINQNNSIGDGYCVSTFL